MDSSKDVKDGEMGTMQVDVPNEMSLEEYMRTYFGEPSDMPDDEAAMQVIVEKQQ